MGKTNDHNTLFFKAVVIILIVSLVFTSTTVFAEGYEPLAADTKVTLDLKGGKYSTAIQNVIQNPVTLTDDTYSELFRIIGTAKPAKLGHNFEGLFPATTGGIAISAGAIAPVRDHTIYAQWTPAVYTLKFAGNGGRISKGSMPVTYGKSYGSLASASRSGYGFIGWYTSAGKKVTSGTIYNIAGNTTLYAKWGKKYRIYFDASKGRVSQKSKTVSKGLPYGTLPTPKRAGRTFLGWYTKGGTKIYSTRTVGITKNTKFYAKWRLNKYPVKFDPRKGKASRTYKNIYYYKKYGKLPKAYRKGYVFKGWYTKGGRKVTSKTVYKLTKGRTLYAKWRAKRITLRFNANRGKVSKKSKVVIYNKKYGKLPKPKRSGYKFKGWYSKKSGGIKRTSSAVVKYTKKKTLYAKWAKISTIKFDYNKGRKSKTKSKRVVYGERYGTLPSTKRSGYIFKGWYTKGGTLITSSKIVRLKGNRTLYARWEFTLNISKMYAPSGSKARPGYAMSFKGVTIHNTGNRSSTADALNHARYLQGSGSKKSASWHYCVDDRRVTQSIPESEIAWHAGDGGSGFGNRRTIAIEICMNDGGNVRTATDRAAKLTAYILERKGYRTAVSGVNLFQHNSHSGKNCPELIRKGIPYNWSTFVSKVNIYL